jgi:hypothetical protein
MCRIVFAFFILSAASIGQSGTATIQGSVTDALNKKPVSGALVTAIRSGLPPASQTATTAPDGSFQIGNLPAGAYSLCVQVPGGAYLDPCQWSRTASKLTLSNGQKSAGNALKLDTGSALQVRFNDPGKLLAKKTKDGRDPHLTVGIGAANGRFYPLHVGSKDSAGTTFQLTVPRDTPLKLQVASRDLKIADASSAAISATGDRQTVQHNSNDPNPKSFQYTITGARP